MGPYLSEIAAVLCNQGYARSSIRRHLRAQPDFLSVDYDDKIACIYMRSEDRLSFTAKKIRYGYRNAAKRAILGVYYIPPFRAAYEWKLLLEQDTRRDQNDDPDCLTSSSFRFSAVFAGQRHPIHLEAAIFLKIWLHGPE